jgi:hypothetical protein
MNENGACIDGRLSKIHEDLVFEYERDALMRPWRIRTAASERVDLRFEPDYERISKADAGAYMSEVHQLFGRYSGSVMADGGEVVRIAGMFGWIEDHVARW